MPLVAFTFQQRAGRTGKRGQSWLEGTSVPRAWLEEMKQALAGTGVVPGRGDEISCRGGVYISGANGIVAIFSFCPTPPEYRDHAGRANGVIVNVLWSKADSFPPGKSLKNAWDHPVMKSGPEKYAREESVSVALDDNMGDSEAEKKFFSSAAEHYRDNVIVLYPGDGEKPRLFPLAGEMPENNERNEQQMSDRPEKRRERLEKPYSASGSGSIRSFILGFVMAAGIGGGYYFYKECNSRQTAGEKQENKLEFSLKKLKKDEEGYHLPLIIGIDEADNHIVIRLSSRDANDTDSNKQTEGKP